MLDMASIVIPTYNESKNLPIIVNKLQEISARIADQVEIVVVDDNSPDGTGKIADDLALRYGNITVVHRPSKMGVGTAVHEGIRTAKSEHIVMMDADLHHQPEFVPTIATPLQDYEIVIASRFIEKSGMAASSFQRRIATKTGNWLARSLLHLGVRDYTHGFRGYQKKAFLECYSPRDTGGEFNLRILVEARKRGFRILEVPYHSEHMGKSKMRDWVKYLWLLIKVPLTP
jgi:dolichol-phosphate mannosyltransferase